MNKLLYALTAIALTLAGCGSSGGGSDASDPGTVNRNLIGDSDFETTDLVLYFDNLAYPGNHAVIIDDKTGGGGNGCSGRVLFTNGASTFQLFDFVGACAHLNATYSYRLTTTCQGYSQVQFVCGSTSLVEIVMSL